MSTPKITVITVCYNAAISIEATILSVISQTYENMEYIIIDGGSRDGTLDLIKKYAGRIAYWVSEPDEGIYDAMNKGIDQATGNWVCFIGAGDRLLNVTAEIAKQLDAPGHIYYGDVYREDLRRIYGGVYPAYKLAVTNICHQAIFYPLSALKKYKYDTRYKLLADHHLNMRCYGDKDYKFKHLPVLISIYEGDGLSAAAPDPDFFKDKPEVIRNNFPLMIYLYTAARRRLAKLLKN